jgi:AcrR family transcriptional regulator
MTPRQAAKLSTRQKIIDTARSAFEMVGYEATTMRLIAKSMGMSTGAVFANFTGKAEIYRAIYGHEPVSPEIGAQLMRAAKEVLRSNPEVAGGSALAAAITLTGVQA